MDPEAFAFLLTPRGQALLEELTDTPITPQNHLALASGLRREVSANEAHALLETALLRQRAAGKFDRASAMYFTRTALEQASHEAVSRYRTQRFARAGLHTVADLGCGIGGDSISLADQALVLGVDRHLLRLQMARENARAYGRAARILPLQADLRQLPPLPVDGFFCDPGRRDERGRRHHTIHNYNPPLLPLLETWLPRVPQGAVKVSPGIDYDEIPPGAETEFVSVDGQVKEGILWFGDLRRGVQRQATLLPSGATISKAQETSAPVPLRHPQAFLYEPDGAVIRAHLVETLAQRLRAAKIDEDIAYLTSSEAIQTPFARCFAIEEALPFQLKRLRKTLRRRGVGRVTVKKRGSPIAPEELQRRLRLDGEQVAIVFLTHVQGEPYALIGREVE